MGLLGYDVKELNAHSEVIGMPLFVTFIGVQLVLLIYLTFKRKKKNNLIK